MRTYIVSYYTVINGSRILDSSKIVSKSTYYSRLHLWTDSTPDNVSVSRETSKFGAIKILKIAFFE